MAGGYGESGGAVSVLNAIPCGIGSTIGVDLKTRAHFELSEKTEIELIDRPGMDDTLARTCAGEVLSRLGLSGEKYRLTVESDIPPSAGLKSSSSVCNAVISAVYDYYGDAPDILDMIRAGVSCARRCGVTVTGAFDDACGCGLGGLVVTRNADCVLLHRSKIPDYDVLIFVPDRRIPKSKVPGEKYRSLESEYRKLASELPDNYTEVMTSNGRYVESICGPSCVSAESLLGEGALAAGVTGTGPAMAALVPPGKGKKISESIGYPAIHAKVIRWK